MSYRPANAGGVTVSYFEWVQACSSFFWREEEINPRRERIMSEAFAAIWRPNANCHYARRLSSSVTAGCSTRA